MKRIIFFLAILAILISSKPVLAVSFSNQGQNQTYVGMGESIKLYVLVKPKPYPWDLSKVFYTGVTLSTQDSNPTGLAWSSDGTKLYEVGNNYDRIYEYTCSNAWDLSSCSYTGTYISTQDSNPNDIAWKTDGTKLYEVGSGNDLIYEYSCTNAWDLSSCSYNNVNISTQDTSSFGIAWSSDGTKLYEVGDGNDLIYEYSCSVAWDLSSCSYNNVNISTVSAYPGDIAWKTDGTKLYELDYWNNLIYEYSCTDPWNLSSCSYNNVNTSVQGTYPNSLFWKTDGSRFYINQFGEDLFAQYVLNENLSIAILSVNISGSWENVSTLDLGNSWEETWANFTYSNSTICDKLVGWKIYANGTAGEFNVTDVATFYQMPYLASSSDPSVISKISTCTDKNNATFIAGGSGSTILRVYMPYYCEDGVCECTYEATNSKQFNATNRTEYCDIYFITQELSAGDVVLLQYSKPLRVLPPPNLPAALTGALVGVIVVIYTISVKRKSEGWS